MSLNDHEIAEASDEKSGNDDSPWGESYQNSVPPFKGIIENDSQRVENNNSQERLDRHSAELMRGFLGENDFNPRKHFGEIQEYVRTRSESLGVEKPVNLFLRYEYFEKTPTGTARQKLRFDPEKNRYIKMGTGDGQQGHIIATRKVLFWTFQRLRIWSPKKEFRSKVEF